MKFLRKSRQLILPTTGTASPVCADTRNQPAARHLRLFACIGMLALLGITPALAEASGVLNKRPTWRPPATPGIQDNLLSMKRIGDWQVTCYKRGFVLPIVNSCELRLHERDMVTGHADRALFVFDMVIEVAHPDTARARKRDYQPGDSAVIEATDAYDFNILLAATPTPSWADGSLRFDDFRMRIEDVCLVGQCILRHDAAERLITAMLDSEQPVGFIQFRDAPLNGSYASRRITVPLQDFDRALNLLIEQTQLHSGY